MLTIVCTKCGTPLIKKGMHHNDKQRYHCTECGLKSVNYDIVNSDDIVKTELQETIDGPNWDIVSTSSEIRTLDQLIKYCRVDLDEWEIKKHTVNSWGSKKNESFQVKAWLSQKVDSFNPKQEIDYFNKIAKNAPTYPKIKYKKASDSQILAEVNIPDIHFGQQSRKKETGDKNYNIVEAQETLIDCINSFCVDLEKHDDLSKILVIIGNDFYNVNSQANTTLAGTQQAEDDRWKKTFCKGWELWVIVIDMLGQLAPVEVKIIPGNHDEERVFYLGETLRAWYSKSDDVDIDNGHMDRKYFQWGKILLGFTHGHKEIKNYLPQLMATEQPQMWADTYWREWRTGHLHHHKKTVFQVIDELQGVGITVLPSLAPTDDWHSGKGYTSMKRAILTLWGKENGKEAEYYYNAKR
jgi:hypothetical protein